MNRTTAEEGIGCSQCLGLTLPYKRNAEYEGILSIQEHEMDS